LDTQTALTTGELVVQIGLFLVAAIAMKVGALQMTLGRLVSIAKVGLPAGVWLGYLIPELLLPVVIVIAHRG